MKIGNWELRKPWVRYVEVELEERFYNEIRKSIGEDIAKEIESKLCDTPSGGCWGVNQEHCDCIRECADIARGNK